jgi:hypothetical protein
VLILVISRGRLACELVDGATINMGGYHPFSWELWKENKRVEGTQIHSFSLFLSLSLSLSGIPFSSCPSTSELQVLQPLYPKTFTSSIPQGKLWPENKGYIIGFPGSEALGLSESCYWLLRFSSLQPAYRGTSQLV